MRVVARRSTRSRRCRGWLSCSMVRKGRPVVDQLLDGEDGQVEVAAELDHGVEAHHRAVVVDELADDADRRQAREPSQVDSRLRVPRPRQHAALAGAQRQDVPGADEVPGRRVAVGEDLDRTQAVSGADARRDSCGGVDRHGVRGAQRVPVLGDHERQLQPVGHLVGHGRAEVARGVADRPRHPLLGGGLRSQDEVALVLAALVVEDEDRTTGLERLEGRLHGRQGHDTTSRRCVSSRSTYFAMTSTSRLTRSPTPLRPKVVSPRVVGIRETPKASSPTCATVRETPSTVIEPFSTTYAARLGGRVKSTVSQRSPGVRAVMVAVPSTCPWTTCPPNRPPAGMARSRLTRAPGVSAPRLLRSSVSAMTSTVKPVSSWSVTVRQTPLTAMEAPWVASLTTSGPSMRSTAESAPCSIAATVPSSSTIPVNMTISSGCCVLSGLSGRALVRARGGRGRLGRDGVDADVSPDDQRIDELESQRAGDRLDAEVVDGGAPGAEEHGGDVRVDVVDQTGTQKGRGERRPALEPDVAKAPPPEQVEGFARVARPQLHDLARSPVD